MTEPATHARAGHQRSSSWGPGRTCQSSLPWEPRKSIEAHERSKARARSMDGPNKRRRAMICRGQVGPRTGGGPGTGGTCTRVWRLALRPRGWTPGFRGLILAPTLSIGPPQKERGQRFACPESGRIRGWLIRGPRPAAFSLHLMRGGHVQAPTARSIFPTARRCWFFREKALATKPMRLGS